MKKRIFYFILGGILFTTASVLAYTLSSNEVYYKKVNNQDMTLEQALDDLYTKTNTQIENALNACPNGKSCISYDSFGTPIFYSNENYYLPLPTSEFPTEAPTNRTVYLGLYEDGQYGVCINKNGTQHCFRHKNWLTEKEHIQQVFPENSCQTTATDIHCEDSEFMGYISPDAVIFNTIDFTSSCILSDNTGSC